MKIECFSRRFCQLCTCSFHSRFCYLLHRHVHKHDWKSLGCSRCNKRFASKILFEKHKLLHKKKTNKDSKIKRVTPLLRPLGLLKRRIPTATRFYVSSPSSPGSEIDEEEVAALSLALSNPAKSFDNNEAIEGKLFVTISIWRPLLREQ